MTVYVILILFTVSLAGIQNRVKRKKDKGVILFLTILIPTLVAAFRYDNGADYMMYNRIFNFIGRGINVNNVEGKTLEIGFTTLVKICQYIYSEQWLTFGVIAFLIVSLFVKGCFENSDNYKYSILLFFITGVYFDSFNGLRQYIAVAIMFYSFKYILEGNFKRYLIGIFIGLLFHTSIIFCVPLYFLRNIKIDAKKAITIIGLVVIFGTTAYKIFLDILQYTPYAYFVGSVELEETIASVSAILFSSITGIIGYWFYSKKKEIDLKTQILFNLHVVTIILATLTMFIPLISRFVYYGMAIDLIYIPNMLMLIKRKRTRQLCTFGITVLYCVITLYGILNNGWYTCYPYNFIFFR